MKSKNPIDESIKLQLEAKALGLDWIELDKIISKIREETDELEEAISMENKAHIQEELGDLFFSLISLSRHLNIDMDDLNKSAKSRPNHHSPFTFKLCFLDKNCSDSLVNK